jgi:NAD(P)-dependent dehydrogenase (short-subunit alcohol dehydrogenase family)
VTWDWHGNKDRSRSAQPGTSRWPRSLRACCGRPAAPPSTRNWASPPGSPSAPPSGPPGSTPDRHPAGLAVDALGAGKAELFDQRAGTNPARRIGAAEDVADAVVFALTTPFLTGVSVGIDGGEPLV